MFASRLEQIFCHNYLKYWKMMLTNSVIISYPVETVWNYRLVVLVSESHNAAPKHSPPESLTAHTPIMPCTSSSLSLRRVRVMACSPESFFFFFFFWYLPFLSGMIILFNIHPGMTAATEWSWNLNAFIPHTFQLETLLTLIYSPPGSTTTNCQSFSPFWDQLVRTPLPAGILFRNQRRLLFSTLQIPLVSI